MKKVFKSIMVVIASVGLILLNSFVVKIISPNDDILQEVLSTIVAAGIGVGTVVSLIIIWDN